MAALRQPKKARSRLGKAPLAVRLSIKFRFGEDESDSLLMIDDREIPMVGGVLAYRDRIVRGFVGLMLKAVAQQPKIIRELTALSQLAQMAQRRRERAR